MPLIANGHTFALCTILLALAGLGFWVDGNRVLKKSSGALWVIAGGALLSNLGVTPYSAGIYDFVFEFLLPLAIPLLLFKANLGRILRESGRVMLAFLCASLATIMAALVALLLIDLGETGPQLAGVIASGYIGGTMNFVAVAQAVELEAGLFSVAIGANSVVSVIALMILVVLPSFIALRRFLPSAIMDSTDSVTLSEEQQQRAQGLKLTHIGLALGLSFLICAAAFTLAEAMGVARFKILFVTAFAVLIASAAPKWFARMEGEFDTGMFIMYLFFAAIGLSTNVTAFLDSALHFFFYALLLVLLHFLLVLCLARVLKIDLAEAVVGSAAALVGPGPTAAIAGARGWHQLVTPGIMCGLFGYVIANFIGVSITALLG